MQAGRFQIGLQLGKMNVFEALDRFEFQNNLAANDQVKTLKSDIDLLKKHRISFCRSKEKPR